MVPLSQNALVLRLERSLSLGELGVLRKIVPIQENNEPLVDISYRAFSFEVPHPYVTAGAPYAGQNPFSVREGVLERLELVQKTLNEILPGHRLHIFDAYRPLAVQMYMVNFTRNIIASQMGLDPVLLTLEQEEGVMKSVYRIWAKPSNDPAQPPPHSTGAAIDLTIIDPLGNKLEMGSAFDEPSERVLPNYFRDDPSDFGRLVHRNRECLNTLMESAGFVRLTHEWWHFSYGDQMWALLRHLIGLEPQRVAQYGCLE